MRKRGEYGVLILALSFVAAFFVTVLNYYRIAVEGDHVQAAEESSFVTIHAGDTRGTIFDRELVPLTNCESQLAAIAVPSAADPELIAEIAEDPAQAAAKYGEGEPFVFRCRKRVSESAGLTFFELPDRSAVETAVHVIGYVSGDSGVSGIEYAYDRLLSSGAVENSVTYSTDGFGHIMIGEGKSVIRSSREKSGIVLTIDSRIQRICEKAGESIEKGAIVVTDPDNGDILALASFPDYDTDDLASALNDSRSPMINRALYSYSVGSIFKLVTACEALNEGLDGYLYDCTGSCDVLGQRFNCHRSDGHGLQDMTEAMTNSCNTYFIELSRCMDGESFRRLAFSLGFGREDQLCGGMIGSAGVLPTAEELSVPAELANFSFGQGRLTATPLQINRLTCAIANGGNLPMLRITRGITLDGETVSGEKDPRSSTVISPETAHKLTGMMISAIYANESSKAAPESCIAAAKTSTAQTGRFGEDGEELCHGWITGFFPVRDPKYAVTVLVEDGGYGNDCAAPVFREIIDGIMSNA